MVAKLIFLGTAGGSIAISKQLRSSGGIILQIDDQQFHIDPGPGSLIKAKESNISLRENTCLLLTHNHLGHTNDANVVIDAMTYGGIDKRGIIIAPKSCIEGYNDQKPILTEQHLNYVERYLISEPNKKIGIGYTDIIGLKTKHSDPFNTGYKFITPYFTLSYTSDTGYSNELIEEYMGSDILIINLKNPAEIRSKNNLNVEDTIKIIKKINPKLVIITHFGHKFLKLDTLISSREIQRQTKIQTIAAKDGMTITPGTYSAKSKQRTLQNPKIFKK